ncbi:hypothetical protein MAP00_008764 [Monascus purpureus]|nr:hypothetical protein MAP00_008764 [Monascus purpureus]
MAVAVDRAEHNAGKGSIRTSCRDLESSFSLGVGKEWARSGQRVGRGGEQWQRLSQGAGIARPEVYLEFLVRNSAWGDAGDNAPRVSFCVRALSAASGGRLRHVTGLAMVSQNTRDPEGYRRGRLQCIVYTLCTVHTVDTTPEFIDPWLEPTPIFRFICF